MSTSSSPRVPVRRRSSSTSSDMEPTSTALPSFLNRPHQILPPIFVIATCMKVLLMPTYRSTDFDVHRNWLAITNQLPLGEWYFNDVHGTTVHTLDYPPNFAYFEWFLSSNPITTQLVFPPSLDDRCLELLPDSNNTPSLRCVVFQRSTVILSDLILWLGTWVACRAFHSRAPFKRPPRRSSMASTPKPIRESYTRTTLSFLLIVLNPGLLWLDHVHFQYNGMLLGILLGSLGLLMWGNRVAPALAEYDYCHLGGAFLYALLLNFKHLYLPLAPIYFWYLLQSYCLNRRGVQWKRFLALAFLTGATLVMPWIPLTLLQDDPKKHFLQILSRLFPFGRGLVHDYWAANVWAFWSLGDKVVRFLGRTTPNFPMTSLPEPSPVVCGLLLLLSILPALVVLNSRRTNAKLLQSVVYTSFCAFMLGYHVHEKAILTAMIPLTLLVEQSPQMSTSTKAAGENSLKIPTKKSKDWILTHNFLFSLTALWGLLGLVPLLFRPVEWAFVAVSYAAYLKFASFGMHTRSIWTESQQQIAITMAGLVLFGLMVLPIPGKWAFLPLLLTSMICAHGLVGCWALSLWLLWSKEPVEEKP